MKINQMNNKGNILIKYFLLPITLWIVFILLVIFALNANASVSRDAAKDIAKNHFSNTELCFEENLGQLVGSNGKPIDNVLFKAAAPGLKIALTTKGLTYVFAQIETNPKDKHKIKNISWAKFNMLIEGASISKSNIVKENASRIETNYFLAHCPNGITKVKRYKKLTVKNIYPNIDWVIFINEKEELKYDFVLRPGSDINNIKLIYEGAGKLNLANKALAFKTPLGTLQEGALYTYSKETEKELTCTYKIKESKNIISDFTPGAKEKNSYIVTFEMPENGMQETVVIDPSLEWLTSYSGYSGMFYGTYIHNRDITSDDFGNTFITGFAAADPLDFLLDPGNGAYFDNTPKGGLLYFDIFILKLNPAGAIIWGTLYGGTVCESPESIKTDAQGNVFITGYVSSKDFPTYDPQGGAFYRDTLGIVPGTYLNGYGDYVGVGTIGQGGDMFMLKFNNAGVRLWATYFGGSGHFKEFGQTLDIDNDGNVYVTGSTSSTDFPILAKTGAYNDNTLGGGQDAFLTEFDNNGVLLWSTYIGGSSTDIGYSLTIDPSDNVYIAGSGPGFPTQVRTGAYNSNSGWVFLAEFDKGGALTWSTKFGGSAVKTATSLTSDNNGNVFMLGAAGPGLNSSLIKTEVSSGYTQPFGGGSYNKYITKFGSTGNIAWSTYYGGSTGTHNSIVNDNATDLVIDNSGNLYAMWGTRHSDEPLLNPNNGDYFHGTWPAPIVSTSNGNTYSAWQQTLIAKFTNEGTRISASYLEGSLNTYELTGAINKLNGALWFSGTHRSAPAVYQQESIPFIDPGNGAYFSTNRSGFEDAFFGRFGASPPDVIGFTYTYPYPCDSSIVSFTPTYTATIDSVKWDMGFPGGDSLTDNKPTVNFPDTNTYNVNIWIYGPYGWVDTIIPYVQIHTEPLSYNAGDDRTINICPQQTSFNLFDSILGTPDTGGIWLPALASGNNIFDPVADSIGTYQYIVGEGGVCPGDTAEITLIYNSAPMPSANIDATYCDGALIADITASGIGTINWYSDNTLANNIGTGSSFSPSNTVGTSVYYATQSINGCESTPDSVTIVINPLPPSPIINTDDTLYCEGEPISDIIAVPISGGSITWYSNPGLTSVLGTGPVLTPITNTGSLTYYVTESSGNCVSLPSTATITSYPIPVLQISNDTVINIGEAVDLFVSGADSYIWNTGATVNNIDVSPEQTTTFTATGSNGPGCNSEASVTVTVLTEENTAYLPNVFSVNSSNQENNRFYVFGKKIEALELTIYDRWGNKVYETTNSSSKSRNSDGLCCAYGEGWDGTHMKTGKVLNPAAFVYKLSVTYLNGDDFFETGNITLIK